MFKSLLAIILLSCCVTFFPAQGCSLWSLQAGASAYYPASHSIRKTYSSVLVDYQIEASRTFFGNWDMWADLDYITSSGNLAGFHDSTRIDVVPISAGVRYYIPVYSNTWWYIGGGGSYTFSHIHHQSGCMKKNLSKWGFGGVFKTGIKYFFTTSFYLTAFVDYFYQHYHLGHSDRAYRSHCSFKSASNYVIGSDTLNVGGLKVGGGLGWTF